MPVDSSVTVMVMPDGRIWLDALTTIDYFRRAEKQAQVKSQECAAQNSRDGVVAAAAIEDVMRQIADSLTLTSMEAGEEVRSRGRVWR